MQLNFPKRAFSTNKRRVVVGLFWGAPFLTQSHKILAGLFEYDRLVAGSYF